MAVKIFIGDIPAVQCVMFDLVGSKGRRDCIDSKSGIFHMLDCLSPISHCVQCSPRTNELVHCWMWHVANQNMRWGKSKIQKTKQLPTCTRKPSDTSICFFSEKKNYPQTITVVSSSSTIFIFSEHTFDLGRFYEISLLTSECLWVKSVCGCTTHTDSGEKPVVCMIFICHLWLKSSNNFKILSCEPGSLKWVVKPSLSKLKCIKSGISTGGMGIMQPDMCSKEDIWIFSEQMLGV